MKLFDDNQVFIWEVLMNDRSRTLAKRCLALVLLLALVVISTPVAYGKYIAGLENKQLAAFYMATGLFVLFEVSNSVIIFLRQQWRERFFQEEFWHLPQAISKMYFARPLSFVSDGNSEIDGGGVESLRDKVWNIIGPYIFQIVPSYAQVAFALVASATVSVWLALIVLVYVVFERYIGRRINQHIQKEMKPVIDGYKRWERRMIEWWTAVQQVWYQGLQRKILNQIHDEVQPALKGDDVIWRQYFAKRAMLYRLRSFGFAMLMYGGLYYLVSSEAVSLANAVLIFFSTERIRTVLGDINDQQREIQSNLASMDKYRLVLIKPIPFKYDEGDLFNQSEISVKLESVSLSVANGASQKLILSEVSLVIAAGEKVGIVGPSGAGKSQLMSLLVRARDPDGGRVMIGGRDLREWSLESLLRFYGVIMQKSEPFEDSLLGNLLFGVSHLDQSLLANREMVVEMAKVALKKAGLCLSDFPSGIDTNIGYKGMRLSGGQQQRLQIAGAHFKLGLTPSRPRLILADEPTASLDSLSELTVMEHLQDSLPEGTTLLMVAHRLSTVARMDKIIFVRPLASCGPGVTQVTMHHSLAELYATEALFREMADAQGFRP